MPRLLFVIALTTMWSCSLLAQEATGQADILVESVVLTIARQADVSAREAGLLNELLVHAGQTVHAGELVAKLDDDEVRLAYQRGLLDVERAQKLADNDLKVRLAKKELEIAEGELKRASQAADRFSKSVTQAELERLKLDVERAALQVQQAEFDLETARLLIRIQENELQAIIEKARRRRIHSPLAGTVVEIHKRQGEWLESGAKVIRVIATDRLRAEGFLDADHVQAQLIGRPVQFTVQLPSLQAEKFTGSVVFVSPEVDPVSGQARMWAEIENREGRLRPGLSGVLRIEAK